MTALDPRSIAIFATVVAPLAAAAWHHRHRLTTHLLDVLEGRP